MTTTDVVTVVDVLEKARGVAANLQRNYRRAHASSLVAAGDSADQLTWLMQTLEWATKVGANEDWELRQLIKRTMAESRRLREDLNHAFNKTIRRGPGCVKKLDQRTELIQLLILRAQERASELQLGTAAVSSEKVVVGIETSRHHRIPVLMIRAAVRLLPILHRGRYLEECMAELQTQRTWADKFDYAFRILAYTRQHRRHLVDGAAYRATENIQN